jgi:hypothetical protein
MPDALAGTTSPAPLDSYHPAGGVNFATKICVALSGDPLARRCSMAAHSSRGRRMADLLHKIVDTYVTEVQSLSDGILVPPATEKEIGLAERDAIQHLGAPLDQEYLDLARLADGLGARGTNVYSVTPRKLVSARTGRTKLTRWFIEENSAWRNTDTSQQTIQNWMIYGIGELEYIIQYLPTGKFQRRSRTEWNRVMEERDSFSEILWQALKFTLQIEDE